MIVYEQYRFIPALMVGFGTRQLLVERYVRVQLSGCPFAGVCTVCVSPAKSGGVAQALDVYVRGGSGGDATTEKLDFPC